MRRAAARSRCANNLKQLGIAVHSYHDARNHLPPGTAPAPDLPPDRRVGLPVVLLPYAEGGHLRFDLTAAWDAPPNAAAAGVQAWPVFQCPDWTGERRPGEVNHGHTNYVGVAGVGSDAPGLPAEDPRAGPIGYDRRVKMDEVKDGLANTALMAETGSDVGPWHRGGPATVRGVDPADPPLLGDGRPFGGTHFTESNAFRKREPIGSHVLFGDGRVNFLRDTADPAVLPALATIAGGEAVPADW